MNIEKIEIKGHYLWVDKDAEINNNSYGIDKNNILCEYADDFLYMFDNAGIIKISITAESIKCREIKKIIAASPELNLEGIPTYVEWLAEQEYPIDILETSKGCFDDMNLSDRNIFIKGYQAAEKELPTWDDVRKAMNLARKNKEFPFNFPNSNEIIEQLKQSKQ